MKIKNLLLLLLLASLWGPSFLFIKIAVGEISPVTVAALRIVIAAATLYLFIFISGSKQKKNLAFWKHVAITGFFAQSLPFILISWGEMYIDSGLASILNGLTPLFTVILANFMISDEKMNIQKITGTVLGFIGLIVLVSPGFNSEVKASVWGIAAITLAAASYGMGMVYTRLHLKGTTPMHAPAAQVLVAAIYMIPLSLLIDGPAQLTTASFNAWGSVLILGIFGTAMAYVVYFRIIENTSASFLSTVTYLIPVFGVVLGVIFLDETISLETLIGAVCILSGLMVANNVLKIGIFRLKAKGA
ncbi:Permease of the drug/metabolite transporter (DMT) superfamily [Fulvivirga imtechensis AK7]|uniref:Permease of the drug/metabolite transporter (DMT) superfamily n=1 Tax=Fulvivirga imtechensis AK7 TaxID=1237149 RepID=L8JJB0_9BACT|nr:EamA family transporter [Fulvivirga imtechensis]ELR68885.1 Permease of the drug/metabolite transporter (DMT) superfamily [Fulvivirga imtechensis AK7]